MKPLIVLLLLMRLTFDGVYSFDIAGKPVNGWISLTVIFLTAFSVFGRRTSFLGLATLFSLSLVASAFYGANEWGMGTLDEAIRLISVLCFFYLAFNLSSALQLSQIRLILLTLAVFCGAIETYQIIASQGLFVGSVWRFAGLMAHPNSAALLYSIALLSVVEAIAARELTKSLAFAGIFILFALTFTLSLSGILTFAISLFALVVFSDVQRSSKVLAFLTAIIALAGLLLVPGVATRANLYANASVYLADDQTNSLVWRLSHWEKLLPFFYQHPFFGLGYGSTTTGYVTGDGLYPHNEYLRILVETGLVGFLLFVILVLSLLRQLSRKIRNKGNHRIARLSIAILLGMLLNAITENTFTYTLPMFLLAAMLASSLKSSESGELAMSRQPGLAL